VTVLRSIALDEDQLVRLSDIQNNFFQEMQHGDVK